MHKKDVNMLNMCVLFHTVIVSEQKTTFSLPFCRKPNFEPLTSLPMQNNVISEVNNCKGKYDETL